MERLSWWDDLFPLVGTFFTGQRFNNQPGGDRFALLVDPELLVEMFLAVLSGWTR